MAGNRRRNRPSAAQVILPEKQDGKEGKTFIAQDKQRIAQYQLERALTYDFRCN